MPQAQSNVSQSIENNFTKGLVTEFTGLNFPENAATDTDNCEYTLIGDVIRRQGIDQEINGTTINVTRNKAVSTYKWNNAGGDGLTQIVCVQNGSGINFFKSSSATTFAPLSTNRIGTGIGISDFTASGAVFDVNLECTYADGNGYLFVFHPNADPFYCTYSNGVITSNKIDVLVRDFSGIPEPGVTTIFRPPSLSVEHQYNLSNQGWLSGNSWSASSAGTQTVGTGSRTFTVAAGIVGVTNGQTVGISGSIAVQRGTVYAQAMSGTVTSYSGTTLVINVTYANPTYIGGHGTGWTVVPISSGYINTWFTAVGNYPSNADVWWYFKNASGVFDPATTVANTVLSSGNAPRGRFLLNPFNQQRSVVSSIGGITDITTSLRPDNGCWFQGRLWFTGVNAQQAATGDEPYYTWSSNIYFSKIVTSTADFGACYQTNDPTSDKLFGILPSDGGVITIPEAGRIYNLFPLQNALLIFAANGVWYLTGSQGIGFAANDYTIVKLASVRSISTTSYVNVQGLPMFWNEEGIYKVEPAKQGTQLLNSPLHVNPLEVNPVTVGSILTFYNTIPLSSKRYARAAYDPIDYRVQWIYRDAEALNTTDRYKFNKILNYNTVNKAFYPYTVDNTGESIASIVYVDSPGGSGTVPAVIKYLYSTADLTGTGFADEHDENLFDWTFISYNSYFVTGYKVHGQGQRRFQVPYLYMYSRLDEPTSYNIQTMWDFAKSGDSGRWSVKQQVNTYNPNFGVGIRRHRLRGRGLVLQIKVSSVDNKPFDIMGWSAYEVQNMGI